MDPRTTHHKSPKPTFTAVSGIKGPVEYLFFLTSWLKLVHDTISKTLVENLASDVKIHDKIQTSGHSHDITNIINYYTALSLSLNKACTARLIYVQPYTTINLADLFCAL